MLTKKEIGRNGPLLIALLMYIKTRRPTKGYLKQLSSLLGYEKQYIYEQSSNINHYGRGELENIDSLSKLKSLKLGSELLQEILLGSNPEILRSFQEIVDKLKSEASAPKKTKLQEHKQEIYDEEVIPVDDFVTPPADEEMTVEELLSKKEAEEVETEDSTTPGIKIVVHATTENIIKIIKALKE